MQYSWLGTARVMSFTFSWTIASGACLWACLLWSVDNTQTHERVHSKLHLSACSPLYPVQLKTGDTRCCWGGGGLNVEWPWLTLDCVHCKAIPSPEMCNIWDVMSVRPHETVQPDDTPWEMMHHECRMNFDWGIEVWRLQRAGDVWLKRCSLRQ